MTDKLERDFAAQQAEALSEQLIEFLHQKNISAESYNALTLYNKLILTKLVLCRSNSLQLPRHKLELKNNTLKLTQTEENYEK